MTSSPSDRCRGGKFCSARTTDGPAITAKHDTICAACVVDIQKRLAELPHLAGALRSFLGGSMKVAYESKVSATHEPAPPMNVAVADYIDEINDVIDRAGGPGIQVHNLIQQPAELFLVWIKGAQQKRHLDGVDRALEIRRIHSRVSNVIGLEAVWRKRHAPCPNCHLPTLGSWVGSPTIECTFEDCGLVMTLDEYEQHCLEEST